MNKLFLFLAACLFFASCSNDLDPVPDEYDGPLTTARISFTTAAMQGDVTTKVTDPTTVNETLIKDIWVLQFLSDGTFRKKAYFYDNVNTGAFEVGLVPATASTIYFIANAGPLAFQENPASETAFKTMAKAITTETSVLYTAGSDISLVMYGVLTAQDVPASGYLENLNVTLTRALARVDLTYTVDATLGTGFDLKRVRVCSVPTSIQYFPPATSIFPASPSSSTVTNFDYSADGIVTNAGGTLTFYLPENMRGTGTNTGTDPRLKSGVDYATYIELIGYTKGTQGGDEIAYRIYPGADNLNDYNLVRNTKYSITTNITGTSPSDSRVKKVDRANCYMILPGQSVLIPVKRANESALGIQIEDVSASGWTASLSWETVSGLVTVDTETAREYGMFKVTAPSSTAVGNALVVVKNASGNVLWSWHIWVSNIDVYTKPLVNGSNVDLLGSDTWMRVNLGATIAGIPSEPTNYAMRGFYYQWGRKDPFLPCANGFTNTTLAPYNAATVKNPSGTLIPSISNNTYENYYESPDYANSLLRSVRYPATFESNWPGSAACVAPSATQAGGASSWGGFYGEPKSVYDPCPAGWRVPSCYRNSTTLTSPWGPWATGGGTSSTTYYYSYYGSNVYPWMGYRNGVGTYSNLQVESYHWTASIASTGAYFGYCNNSTTFSQTNTSRAVGCAVRCVKEW